MSPGMPRRKVRGPASSCSASGGGATTIRNGAGGHPPHAARVGRDWEGVASFHGSLGRTHTAQPGDVKARVLVCHGEDDAFVSAEEQAGFRREMDELGVDYKFVTYPGAKHGFTNPDATENGRKYGLPLEYNENVDRESWQEMKGFWAGVFA